MERGRRGASRNEAAKSKLAELRELQATGKKRAELFEVEKEASVYDEARPACRGKTGAAPRAARWRARLRQSNRPCGPPRPNTSWTRGSTATSCPSGARRRAASW